MIALDELIRSIHDLEAYLKKFEEKYLLRSEDFYRLVTSGKLEQSEDFIEWLGVYEIKLKREEEYQKRVREILDKQREVLHLPLSEPTGV